MTATLNHPTSAPTCPWWCREGGHPHRFHGSAIEEIDFDDATGAYGPAGAGARFAMVSAQQVEGDEATVTVNLGLAEAVLSPKEAVRLAAALMDRAVAAAGGTWGGVDAAGTLVLILFDESLAPGSRRSPR